MWTEYNSDFETFYRNYIEDQKQYTDNHAIIAKPDVLPENNCIIDMLQWIQFTNYTPIPYGNEVIFLLYCKQENSLIRTIEK